MKSADISKPPIICAGLPRSGSTWVFNIVRSLLLEQVDDGVAFTIYADEINDQVDALLASGDSLIVKSHAPAASLRAIKRLRDVKGIISLRSPYECTASLIDRFGFTFSDALTALHRSCSAILPLLDMGGWLVLRYEDGFTKDVAAIDQIANFLSLKLDDGAKQRLLGDFSSESVRARLRLLQEQGKFAGRDPASEFDLETHWHYNHLGLDARSPFSVALTRAQVAVLGYALRDLLPGLGYQVVDVISQMRVGSKIGFGELDLGAAFLRSGFGMIEDWGVWSIDDVAELEIPLDDQHRSVSEITIHCRLGPALRSSETRSRSTICINGDPHVAIMAADDNGDLVSLSIPYSPCSSAFRDRLRISFLSERLRSPVELGFNGDIRKLGIGLLHITLGPAPD